MNKPLAICPSCETAFVPKPAMAPRAPGPKAPAPVNLAGESGGREPNPEDTAAPSVEGESALATEGGSDADGEPGAALIEEASELGQDEDDMTEVLNAGTDKEEAQP